MRARLFPIAAGLVTAGPAVLYSLATLGPPTAFVAGFALLALPIGIATVFLIVTLFLATARPVVPFGSGDRAALGISAAIAFLLFGGWWINRHCLPAALHPVSLLGDGAIVIFSIFLGRSILLRSSGRRLATGSIAFALVVLVLMAVDVAPRLIDPESRTEALKALPYLTWVPAAAEERGVTLHDEARAYPGLNLYSPRNLATARLIDMEGRELHSWSANTLPWHHVEMDRNGNLFAIVEDRSLVKLDWSSKVLWTSPIPAHHDVAIGADGSVYVLTRGLAVAFRHGLPFPLLDDRITILSPEGSVEREISLDRLFGEAIPLRRWLAIYPWLMDPANLATIFTATENTPHDLFHSNTVEVVDRPLEGFGEPGDLLLSIRELDTIAVVRLDPLRVVWRWGPGTIREQHHPSILDDGNVLVFDNGGRRRFSRVVEVNPRSGSIEWEYRADPPESFFSVTRGASQRLPNGNTLITESDSGRVFEVTREGETVWEFFNPEIRASDETRSAIYRMVRIVDPVSYPRLAELQP